MSLHVDIVKNDWLGGRQVRVGLLVVNDGAFDFLCDDERIRDVVLRPVTDREADDVVHIEKEPERFAHLLHSSMSGSRLFATPPYEDSSGSAFRDTNVLAMRTIAV